MSFFVHSFLLFPYFVYCSSASLCFVFAVSNIIFATVTLFLLRVVLDSASCSLEVALLSNSSAAFNSCLALDSCSFKSSSVFASDSFFQYFFPSHSFPFQSSPFAFELLLSFLLLLSFQLLSVPCRLNVLTLLTALDLMLLEFFLVGWKLDQRNSQHLSAHVTQQLFFHQVMPFPM